MLTGLRPGQALKLAFGDDVVAKIQALAAWLWFSERGHFFQAVFAA
jgi:hypothetical protein